MSDISKCPVMHSANKAVVSGSTSSQHWWPEQLNCLAEVYAEAGAEAKSTVDFIAIWGTVMMADCFVVKMASHA